MNTLSRLIRNSCTTIALGILVFAVTSDASESDNRANLIRTWGDSLVLDQRVPAEIERFQKEEDEFRKGYSFQLASGIRNLIFESAVANIQKLSDGENSPFIEVSFPEPGFTVANGKPSGQKSEKKFEKGFVRTEMLASFKTAGITPREAMQIFSSPEFRKKVSPRIKRIWREDDKSCLEIDGVKMILSPTLSCSRVNEYHEPGMAMQHSQVVSNGSGEDYQIVYFKESLKVFVSIPGGIALYYINLTRSADMGWPKKSIAPGKIKESRQKAIEKLQDRLNSSQVQ